MADVEDRLRQMLNRKAGEVSPNPVPPPGMLRRGRRRVAMTLAGGALITALVAAGAFAGIRTLTVGDAERPGVQVPPPVVTGSPTATPVGQAAQCPVSAIDAALTLEGAAGSFNGSMEFTNRSETTCDLRGRPGIALEGPGAPYRLDVVTTAPWWRVDSDPKPPGWPVVRLAPGATARVRFSWSNWCEGTKPVSWNVTLPHASEPLLIGVDQSRIPSCPGPGLPSTVQRGPFEPQA